MRNDGRLPEVMRPAQLHRGYTRNAAGSVMIEVGRTRVLCTASLEARVPDFLEGKGKGWLTAEYNMLPGSTSPRKPRDRKGSVDSRGVEIQRLIGRALRNAVNLEKIEGFTAWIDCDVLDADGGTRTAAITGGFVALVDAVQRSPLAERAHEVFVDSIAAVSVGIVDGVAVVDLDYSEDSTADVDMNLVMTGSGRLVELQGTGEQRPFTFAELETMLQLGRSGIESLTAMQCKSLAEFWPWPGAHPGTGGAGSHTVGSVG